MSGAPGGGAQRGRVPPRGAPANGIGGLTRLLPVACLIAAICLFASELMTMFEFTPPGAQALDSQSGADRHGYALALIAVFAIGALAVAVFAASKPAATAVAIAGAVALLIFLLVDLPDANAVGTLANESQSFFDAEAVPQGGFWLEMLAGIALTITGIALATLTPEQLAALRPPGKKPSKDHSSTTTRRRRKGGSAPIVGRHAKAAKTEPGQDAGRSTKRA